VFIKNVTGFVSAQIELIKLEIKENMASVMSKLLFVSMVLIILLLIIVFASICLAYYLNQIMDSQYGGFLILSGFYFVVLISLLIVDGRINIANKIKNYLLKYIERS